MSKNEPNNKEVQPLYPPYLPYPPYEEDEIDLYELWLILKKRAKLIISITLSAIILSTIIAFSLPPIYRAETTIVVSKNKIFDPLGALIIKKLFNKEIKSIIISTTPTTPPTPTQAIALNILKSYEIKKLVAQKLHIDIKLIQTSVKIERNRKEGGIKIVVENKNPETALHITKEYLNFFKQLINQKVNQEVQKNIEILTTKMNIKNKEIIQFVKKLNNNFIKIYVTDNPHLVVNNPVKPKKKLIITVSAVSALFFSIFLAFFLEWLEKVKERNSSKNN